MAPRAHFFLSFSAQGAGDHWRKRHDKFKMMVHRLCVWAGLDCEVEVFNLFAGSIPQEGLSRMERGRKLKSIVPDLRISLPNEDNLVPSLHEIKIISSCPTRYAPHRRGQEATKAVDVLGRVDLGSGLKKLRPSGNWEL